MSNNNSHADNFRARKTPPGWSQATVWGDIATHGPSTMGQVYQRIATIQAPNGNYISRAATGQAIIHLIGKGCLVVVGTGPRRQHVVRAVKPPPPPQPRRKPSRSGPTAPTPSDATALMERIARLERGLAALCAALGAKDLFTPPAGHPQHPLFQQEDEQ